MCKPIVQGVSVLGLLLGGGASAAQAQGMSHTDRPIPYLRAAGPANCAGPGTPGPPRYRWPVIAVPRRTSHRAVLPPGRVAFQEPAPSMPPTPDAGGPGPGPMTEPTSPNPAEITFPEAERAGGGGEPTEAEEAIEEEEAARSAMRPSCS